MTMDNMDNTTISDTITNMITSLLANKDYDKLRRMAASANIDDFTVGWRKGRIKLSKLLELCNALTGNEITKETSRVSRLLVKTLKENNLITKRTTITTNGNTKGITYYLIGDNIAKYYNTTI